MRDAAIKKDKLWTFSYIQLIFISTMQNFGLWMVQPLMGKYVVSLGGTVAMAGLVSGVFAISALVIRPFAGVIVDKMNKKRLLVIAITLIGLSSLGFALTTNINLILMFRILYGAAFSISLTGSAALLSEYVPKTRMGEGFSYMAIGAVFSTTLAPNFGLTFGALYGYKYSLLIATAFTMSSAIALAFFKYKFKPIVKNIADKKPKFSFKNLFVKEVLIFSLIAGLFSFSTTLESTFLPIYAGIKGINNIGMYFSVGAIALFVGRMMSGKIFDKKGLAFILYPSMIFVSIAMVILGTANLLWVMLIAACLRSIGHGSSQPALQANSIKIADPARRGAAMSTFFIGPDIGQGIGPIVGGLIAGWFGYQAMFYFGAAVLMISVLFVSVAQRASKKIDSLN